MASWVTEAKVVMRMWRAEERMATESWWKKTVKTWFHVAASESESCWVEESSLKSWNLRSVSVTMSESLLVGWMASEAKRIMVSKRIAEVEKAAEEVISEA